MDHSQAISNQAVERYLLGELAEVEAEEFELHYFECPQCATAVESGTQLISNAKAAWEEPIRLSGGDPARRRRGWNVAWLWRPAAAVPLAAAVVLGTVALYQGLIVIPGMRQVLGSARVLPAFQLTGTARGEVPHIRVPRGTPWVAISEDIPSDIHYSQYLCVLISAGVPVFRVTAPAPGAGQPITILLPVQSLHPGDYGLVIYGPGGGEGDKITTSSFQFELQ